MSVRTLLVLSLLAGCDARDAWHRPTPGTQRMQTQRRVDTYAETREAPRGTVARNQPYAGNRVAETGRKLDGSYVTVSPLRMDLGRLHRGRAAFETVCATCHGILGDGQSVVADKMTLRRPPSLFEPRLDALPAGRLFEVASQGYGLMPGFSGTLSVDDRWAIVAYVDALRASQTAELGQLPSDLQAQFTGSGR